MARSELILRIGQAHDIQDYPDKPDPANVHIFVFPMGSTLEFREVVANLATSANCVSFDSDLWELLLTHESFSHERSNARQLGTTDERAAARLLDILEHIGRSALRVTLYEYCLDRKGMDPVETSLCWQTAGVVFEAFADDFELIGLYRVGRGLKDFLPTKGFKETLAGRFLGGIVVSSSYENLRLLTVQRLESTIFSSPGVLGYARIDPKSWLQEYTQRYHVGKSPTYQLLSESGPDHAKQFEYSVTLPDKKTARSFGSTVKEAQKLAATALLTSA